MANPNIASASVIFGDNALLSLTSTAATVVASNPANSNRVLKINSVIVANSNSATPALITLTITNQAGGAGTAFPVSSSISVPARTSLIALDKATSVYLKENQSLVATASAANFLTVVASWEEIG